MTGATETVTALHRVHPWRSAGSSLRTAARSPLASSGRASGSGSSRSPSPPATTAAPTTPVVRTGRSRSTRISIPPSRFALRSRPSADAVHPGYGFLAENGDFAEAVIAAGLTWVGPSPEALRLGGDKLAAKRIAREAGVPTVPQGSAAEIGYPLVVKAAAGGGGRGMRVVRAAAELDDALAAAQREAEAAFGDGTVFCERYLERPRHVEAQLLGHAGGVAVLGARDCSIQRRHQKLIEESPAVGLDPTAWPRIAAGAVAFAEAIGYEGAGTAEFLVDGSDVYFLELNGRIQVEHPVTEEVTGLDIVELQLRVAAGEPVELDGRVAGSRDRGAPLRRGPAVVPPSGRDDPQARAARRDPGRCRRRGGRRDRALVRSADRQADRPRRRPGRRDREAGGRARRRPSSRASRPTCPSSAGSCAIPRFGRARSRPPFSASTRPSRRLRSGRHRPRSRTRGG